MRPIDADALKTDLTRFYDGEVTAKQLIDEQPTVDAVPVVRCETCTHWRACESDENDCDIYGTCDQIRRMTMYDWFCADGEVGTYAADG